MNLKKAKEEMIQKSSDLTKTYILADDYIRSASEALGLELDDRVTECTMLVNQRMMGHLYFHVLKHDFEDWMSNHARLLGVSFVHKETYEFRGNLNKIHGHRHRRSYSCNHAGKKYVKASEQDPDGMSSDYCADGQEAAKSTRRTRNVVKKASKKAALLGCHVRRLASNAPMALRSSATTLHTFTGICMN